MFTENASLNFYGSPSVNEICTKVSVFQRISSLDLSDMTFAQSIGLSLVAEVKTYTA